jgi:hypothetical protein
LLFYKCGFKRRKKIYLLEIIILCFVNIFSHAKEVRPFPIYKKNINILRRLLFIRNLGDFYNKKLGKATSPGGFGAEMRTLF